MAPSSLVPSLALLLALPALAACSSSSSAAPPGTFLPEVACSDSIDSVYADPGDVTAQAHGAILKCAHDTDISRADLLTAAQMADDAGTPGYSGAPFTSGAHTFRVLYRTERGDTANSPGYSSALVLLPDTPRAGHSPLIVASHGSRGQAGQCAASKMDPAASDVNGDFIHLVYPLVGFGYAVIAPDLAGYANYGAAGNPPSAYADSLDEGKSTLDGARALRNLVPGSLTEQVVLVGHSLGGHTALSALAMASTYAPETTISAVAVFAPLWFTQQAWAALFLEPTTFPFATTGLGAVSVWYHYTHGELLDGAGQGVGLFQPSVQAGVQAFENNDCWSSLYPDLAALGTSANDLFLSSYVSSMEGAVVAGDNCAGNATCTTWVARMEADWPHLDAPATQVPTLIVYGNDDQTVTPDLEACAAGRLTQDKANYQVCYDGDPVGHSGIVSAKADYVAQWIAAQTLGAAPPAACPLDQSAIVDDAGAPVPCNPLLPKK